MKKIGAYVIVTQYSEIDEEKGGCIYGEAEGCEIDGLFLSRKKANFYAEKAGYLVEIDTRKDHLRGLASITRRAIVPISAALLEELIHDKNHIYFSEASMLSIFTYDEGGEKVACTEAEAD